jgi:hypothetical protein
MTKADFISALKAGKVKFLPEDEYEFTVDRGNGQREALTDVLSRALPSDEEVRYAIRVPAPEGSQRVLLVLHADLAMVGVGEQRQGNSITVDVQLSRHSLTEFQPRVRAAYACESRRAPSLYECSIEMKGLSIGLESVKSNQDGQIGLTVETILGLLNALVAAKRLAAQ